MMFHARNEREFRNCCTNHEITSSLELLRRSVMAPSVTHRLPVGLEHHPDGNAAALLADLLRRAFFAVGSILDMVSPQYFQGLVGLQGLWKDGMSDFVHDFLARSGDHAALVEHLFAVHACGLEPTSSTKPAASSCCMAVRIT